MADEFTYFPYQLSWISFNNRVLQEAADTSNPVIERLRFLGIFSNNQDEFFRVRVADLQREAELAAVRGDDKTAIKLLRKVQKRISESTDLFSEIHSEINAEMSRRKIHVLTEEKLSQNQGRWLKNYFRINILPHIVPLWIEPESDLGHQVNDRDSYLVVEIRVKFNSHFALIDIPSGLPRFIQILSDESRAKKYYMLIDDVIRYCMDDIFGHMFKPEKMRAWSMKINRDAEYQLDNDLDTALLEKMAMGVKQRQLSEPIRFSFDKSMPYQVQNLLANKLGFDELDSLVPGGRYRNLRDFIGFPNLGPKYLENVPIAPIKTSQFADHITVFDAISNEDILLYYPYHQFNHFSEFVRQAAFDPAVTEIRINVYRVADHSLIVDSLLDAARNGKKVVVNVELKARFDESHNIELSEQLADAGIKVTLGIPTLKVHSKLCLVVRREGNADKLYAHVGTGNFNEDTARIYTDFSLFTAHQEICQEVRNVFTYIEYSFRRFDFEHLMVSPVNTRDKLMELIEDEIRTARKGKKAAIDIKVNNLVDQGLIDALYNASNAGVKIRLIVRGMCSLIPGQDGMSENITAISIVDRFLEHPRVMVFHNHGDPKVFISSADWMTRNIDRRVEVGCPIYSKKLARWIIEILDLQFRDTVKARVIDGKQNNNYVKRGNRKKIRSQMAIYDYLKGLEKG